MRITLAATLAATLAGLAGCGPAPAPVFVVATPAFESPFCTRTLGVAECFADPAALPDHPTKLSDYPVRVYRRPAPWWRIFD